MTSAQTHIRTHSMCIINTHNTAMHDSFTQYNCKLNQLPVCVCVHLCVCVFVCVHLYVCVHLHWYVCVCVCVSYVSYD